MILDVHPVALVRGTGTSDGLLDQYVNDQPYAASSFLSVAMGRLMREAISGRSKERQSLADRAIPLEAVVTPLPARGGAELVVKLFEPLDYKVTCTPIQMDPERPDWGNSPFVALTLAAETRLSQLQTHLDVLIPVLDARKHYVIGDGCTNACSPLLHSKANRSIRDCEALSRDNRLLPA